MFVGFCCAPLAPPFPFLFFSIDFFKVNHSNKTSFLDLKFRFICTFKFITFIRCIFLDKLAIFLEMLDDTLRKLLTFVKFCLKKLRVSSGLMPGMLNPRNLLGMSTSMLSSMFYALIDKLGLLEGLQELCNSV